MLRFKILFLFILIPREFNFFIGFLSLTPYRLLLLALAPFVLFSIVSKRRFRWEVPDTIIVLFSIWPIFALTANTGLLKGIESGGILFLELSIPYFLTRQTRLLIRGLKISQSFCFLSF